jgi:hypothetical protein
MQNSGIATPEVEVYSSFAMPKSVKLMEFNRTATQFFHTSPLASARDAKLLHFGKNL